MSVHFPIDMKRRLITKHNTIKKTFLHHCFLHLNAKVTFGRYGLLVSETATSEDDRPLFAVSFVAPSTQSHSTSPIHDLYGAQICSDCEETTVSLVPRFLLTHVAVLHFFLFKGTCCLKLLMPTSNAIGKWHITVELLPECPLNRNNWFMLCKLQHTKCFPLRSCHYHFVTSQTEGEDGSRTAPVHKTWTPAVSFHVETYFCMCFQSRNGRLKLLKSFWYTLYLMHVYLVWWWLTDQPKPVTNSNITVDCDCMFWLFIDRRDCIWFADHTAWHGRTVVDDELQRM